MSQHLESMKIGDTIDVKGPLGEFIYRGFGSFSLKGKPGKCSRITLIAGGTGLTPCYQVLAAVLREAQDATQPRLLCANRTSDDILMRKELDSVANSHPDRFQLKNGSVALSRAPLSGSHFIVGKQRGPVWQAESSTPPSP